ncbi:MAG: metal ABC transporter substrate-binding protein [Acidimicrobiales bacterium]
MNLRKVRCRSLPTIGLALLLLTAACSAADRSTSDGRPTVVAAFYPLAFVAERIGGADIRVVNLTKPGGEPHELELTPDDVATVVDADLVVYLSGFQPAVDEAVTQAPAQRVVDVRPRARLTRALGEGGVDPHFWLDPLRLRDVAAQIADRLATLDPAHREAFRSRAATLTSELDTLDADYRTTLGACRQRVLVTSHSAFGYLADRYGLEQRGITGLSPEAEPTPDALADTAEYVRAHHVTTIYFETLVSPAIAKTVASETGATTAVLDPLEGLADASAGDDYRSVMRSNLATLAAGQECR